MTSTQYTPYVFILLLCTLFLPPRIALATEPARLLLILDASGSMWGRLEGQPKITIAQAAAAEIMQSLPENIAAGLMLYGHRRKGDCQDIELAVAPGAARQLISTRLAGVVPKGKTPLAKSLEQAGQLLAQGEAEATVLLVSDGIETCGGDPCAVVTALRNKGIKLVVHVVGFDVRGAAVEQLQCIARAGGGGYFPASDTAALRQALQSVRSAVVEHKAPAPPPPPAQAAATPEAASASKRVRIAGPGTVELVPAAWVKMPPRQWALIEAESGERRAEGSGNTASVKEGEYQVLWKQSEHGHSEVTLTETVQVQSGQTVKLPLDTGLKLVTPSGLKAPHWWGLLADGETLHPEVKYPDCLRFRDTLEPQLTPAGAYHLLWRQSEYYPTVDLGLITLASGRLNEFTADSGLMLQPADWVTKQPYFYALLDGQGKQTARWNVYGPQLAPPGKYTLLFRPTEHGHGDIVWGEVEIPAHGMQAVALNSGIQFVHGKETPPPYRIYLVDLTSKREIVMKQSWGPLPLPPGRYRLDWHQSEHGSKRSTLTDELVVEPGTLLEIEM